MRTLSARAPSAFVVDKLLYLLLFNKFISFIFIKSFFYLKLNFNLLRHASNLRRARCLGSACDEERLGDLVDLAV